MNLFIYLNLRSDQHTDYRSPVTELKKSKLINNVFLIFPHSRFITLTTFYSLPLANDFHLNFDFEKSWLTRLRRVQCLLQEDLRSEQTVLRYQSWCGSLFLLYITRTLFSTFIVCCIFELPVLVIMDWMESLCLRGRYAVLKSTACDTHVSKKR